MKLHPETRDTLLPGRALPPRAIFLLQAALRGLATSVALTVYGLYVVRDVGLSPLQLVLLGTGLEIATFLAEVPTGVVADAYSRRLSIITAYVVTALGWLMMAAVPTFAFVFAGQVIWGIGWTFGSGAREAWLADEIGEEAAARLYLRAEQVWFWGHLAGIPLAVALGQVSLQVAIAAGAAVHLVLAGVLLTSMTERHWRPAPRGDRRSWEAATATLGSGIRAVRTSPILVGILVIALLGGVASEALDRLWPYHMVQEFDFPALGALGEVGWFGVIQAGSVIGSIGATIVAGRLTRMGESRSLIRSLVAITVMLMVAVAVFAISRSFWLALIAFWATDWVRAAEGPLRMAWVNRGLDPRSRATVLSLYEQSDALGQLGGGPVLGIVATLRSVRTALVTVAVVLAPTIPLYRLLARREGRIKGDRPR